MAEDRVGKAELIDALASRVDITKEMARSAIRALFGDNSSPGLIEEALRVPSSTGRHEVRLYGFGRIYMTRNPERRYAIAGKIVSTRHKFKIRFTPSKQLTALLSP